MTRRPLVPRQQDRASLIRPDQRRSGRTRAAHTVRIRFGGLGLGMLLCLAWPAAALAVAAGQLDTFQNGTTLDWAEGIGGFGVPPVPPAAVPNAGPDGAGDFALRLTATGALSGAGSKLVVNNIQPRWTGSYSGAGVNGMIFDVRNLNAFALTIRVAIDGPAVGPTGGRWVSHGVVVPASSGWRTLVFALRPQDLVPADLTGTNVATTLGNVAVLRILHSPTPAWTGVPVAGQLDLDNIEALPEPSVGLALLVGALFVRSLGSCRRR